MEYSDPYFNILYKDGSVETLTRKQLSKLLVYDDDVKALAERDSYPNHTLSGRCLKKHEPKGKTATVKNKSEIVIQNKQNAGSRRKEAIEGVLHEVVKCIDWVPRPKFTYLPCQSRSKILEEDLFCDVLCSDKVLVTDQKALAERMEASLRGRCICMRLFYKPPDIVS